MRESRILFGLISVLLIASLALSGCKSKAKNEKQPPLSFKWSDENPVLTEEFDSLKRAIIRRMTDDNILAITGLYMAEESTPIGYANMGFARAGAVRDLFTPIVPEDRISLRAQLADTPNGIKKRNFEAVSFEWIDLDKAPVRFQLNQDQSRCDEIMNVNEAEKQSADYCDLLVAYLDKYQETGLCSEDVLKLLQEHCYPDIASADGFPRITSREQRHCREIMEAGEAEKSQSTYCDLLDSYIGEYGENGLCYKNALQLKQRYCIPVEASMVAATAQKKSAPCQRRISVDGNNYQAVNLGPIWMLTEDVGRMSWQEALQSCPRGWRLPCESEIHYLLKHTYGNSPSRAHTHLTENSRCKPRLQAGGGFNDPVRGGLYWIATENTDRNAWFFQLDQIDGRRSMNIAAADKTERLNCRCVQTNNSYRTKLIACPNRPF